MTIPERLVLWGGMLFYSALFAAFFISLLIAANSVEVAL